MKYLSYKVIFCCIFFLISLSNPLLVFSANIPIKEIVFFGDSLSDDGNLYRIDFGVLPKSPPYFQGRFSNGEVWSDLVAQYYQTKNGINFSNYAVGGETVIFHDPVKGYLPFSLTASLDEYLLKSAFSDRENTLFIIWIGANDYLPGTTNVDELTTTIVNNIKADIERLIYHGGLNFLILNLPDLSKTPYGQTSAIHDELYQLASMHNTKLMSAITEIQQNYKGVNIYLYDVNQLFNDFLTNITFYNQKYNMNITNTTTPCWQGAYTHQQVYQTAKVQAWLNRMHKQSPLPVKNNKKVVDIDSAELANYIVSSPDLMEAYQLSQANDGSLCPNPENYMFWDHVHITTVIHRVLSQYVIDYINLNFTAIA